MVKRLAIVVSDLHMGAGHAPGQVNPHDDFFLDERFAELVGYYNDGHYRDAEVELIINGDFFDLLKVPVDGVWPDEVTEAVSMNKLKSCIDGHPAVIDALRAFIETPGKRITYLPGNHDMDFHFAGCRRLFCAAITGRPEDPRLKFVVNADRYELPEGVQVIHGHQYEPIHSFNYEEIVLTKDLDQPVLNLPWGSFFVLNVVNPLKYERPYLDQVRPFYPFLIFGLLTDFRFTLRVMFRSFYYFFKTRLYKVANRKTYFRKFVKLLREDLVFFPDLERFAERILRTSFGTRLVVMGHSHYPMVRSYGPDKLYINTGTWTRMISLTIGNMGSTLKPAYAVIELDGGVPRAKLYHWLGAHRPFEQIDL